MKFIDRTEKYLKEAFDNEALKQHKEEREIRENRKILKKARIKHVRNVLKKNLRKMMDEN